MQSLVLLVTLVCLSTVITAKHICFGARHGSCTVEQTIACYQCVEAGLGIKTKIPAFFTTGKSKIITKTQDCKCNDLKNAHKKALTDMYNATILLERGWNKDGGINLIEKVIRIIFQNIGLQFEASETSDVINKLTLKLISPKHYAHLKIKVLLDLNNKAAKQKVEKRIFQLLVSIAGKDSNKRTRQKHKNTDITKAVLSLIETLLIEKPNDTNFSTLFGSMAHLVKQSASEVVQLVIQIANITGYDEKTKDSLVTFLDKLDLKYDSHGNNDGLGVLKAAKLIFSSYKTHSNVSKSLVLESITDLIANGADSKLIFALVRAVSTVKDLVLMLRFITKHISDKMYDDISKAMKNIIFVKDDKHIRYIFDLISWRLCKGDSADEIKHLLESIIYMLITSKSHAAYNKIVKGIINILKLKGSINDITPAFEKAVAVIKTDPDTVATILCNSIIFEIRDKYRQDVCLALIRLVIFLFGYGNMHTMPYLGKPKQLKLNATNENPPSLPTDTRPPPEPFNTTTKKTYTNMTSDFLIKRTKVCPCEDIPLSPVIQQMLKTLDRRQAIKCIQKQCFDCFRGVCGVCLHSDCIRCALDNCKDDRGEIVVTENDPVPCWTKTKINKRIRYNFRENMTRYCYAKYKRLKKALDANKKKRKQKKEEEARKKCEEEEETEERRRSEEDV